jgi:hypothetical protein
VIAASTECNVVRTIGKWQCSMSLLAHCWAERPLVRKSRIIKLLRTREGGISASASPWVNFVELVELFTSAVEQG